MSEIPRRVVVLGGGPAGLAAARELSAAGVDVVVLERAPWVGGLSMTREHKGFRFDLGGHRWFTKKTWLNDWFCELMEGELVTVNRISRIYFGGRYYPYPIQIFKMLGTLGLWTSLTAVTSYLGYLIRTAGREQTIENIEDAYLAQFGPKLFAMFFERYTEKVWGRPCRELSADWVTQRTKGLSIVETVRDALLKDSGKESLVDRFLYPRLGYQRISERMSEDVQAHGGRVLLDSNVIGVFLRPDAAVVRYRRRDGDVSEIDADHVISTIPLGRLARIMTPKAPSRVLDAAKGLDFRSVITANLLIDKEQVTSDTWLYVQEPGIGFARIHEPRNWSSAMSPPGKTSLCMEWFCSVGDEIWELSDDEIVERTVAHLADDLGFVDRDEVMEGIVLRARDAYPVYTLDYDRRVSTVKEYLSRYAARISIAGRGGTFRYNNADHSIEMGILVARSLLGHDIDPDMVNAEKEYHEEKVVDA